MLFHSLAIVQNANKSEEEFLNEYERDVLRKSRYIVLTVSGTMEQEHQRIAAAAAAAAAELPPLPKSPPREAKWLSASGFE